MRNNGRSLLVLPLVLATALAAVPARATHLSGPCDLHRGDEETVQQFSKRRIACAVDRLGPVRGGARRAICIARRESGLDPKATSATGEYRGLFQHDRDFWSWRYDTYTRSRWELSQKALNGRTNAIVTIRMVVDFGSWKRAGWPRKEC